MTELGFTFAVQNIPENLGQIELHQVSWNGTSGEKIEEQVPLEPCETLAPYKLSLTNEYTRARMGEKDANLIKYLCPSSEAKLMT